MCGPCRATCPPSFGSKVIYSIFIQIQIISHEINSSHFSTSEIFVNNLVLGSHWAPITPKNVKIRLSRNSMKFVWVTISCETNPTVSSVSSSEIWRIFRVSTYILLWQFTILRFFRKIRFFSGFTFSISFIFLFLFPFPYISPNSIQFFQSGVGIVTQQIFLKA